MVDKDNTTIIGGGGDKKAIEGRCSRSAQQIEKTDERLRPEKLEERLAKLSGGVAVIRVGRASEAEMKSRKEAFDDAISATKAAMAEGIVPGGGLALLRAIDAVEQRRGEVRGRRAHRVCRSCKRALEAPTRQIAENSGVDGGVVVNRMRAGSGSGGQGGPVRPRALLGDVHADWPRGRERVDAVRRQQPLVPDLSPEGRHAEVRPAAHRRVRPLPHLHRRARTKSARSRIGSKAASSAA